MTYKFCKACNKRISSKIDYDYCTPECQNKYETAPDKICLVCNIYIGKEGITEKTFCSNNCHNENQRATNKVSRNCVQCDADFIVQRSSRRLKTCSTKCEKLWVASEERNVNRMETFKKNNMEKYGVEHVLQVKEYANKMATTKLMKYGNRGYNNNAKSKDTKLERYGLAGYNNSTQIVATKLKKYGKAHFNEKSNVTKLEKYGTLDFSDKAQETTLKKYGTLDFSKKSVQTRKDKYGSLSALSLKHAYNKLKKKYQDILEFKFEMEDYVGSIGYKKYPFTCKICATDFIGKMTNGISPRCPTCNPFLSGTSAPENAVADYISTLYADEIVRNTRKILPSGLELDIYLPEKKLAIEFNGNYWHSELQGKDKNYHLNKTKECESLNIRLIQIFESEWEYKQEIVKSILRAAINPASCTKIAGRKCEIREVSSKECNIFLEENHLQGKDKASIRYGLYYDNRLASVMTFVKSRYDKSIEWEMSRYAIALNTTILGGAQKLFAHFLKENNPQSIITYSDRRYFTGTIYESLGFALESYTVPAYHYFYNETELLLESRVQYQKHKLIHILPNFNPNDTEWNNMVANGYNRIWDCGHKKFIYNLVGILPKTT